MIHSFMGGRRRLIQRALLTGESGWFVEGHGDTTAMSKASRTSAGKNRQPAELTI
jgi:hypothetical protein